MTITETVKNLQKCISNLTEIETLVEENKKNMVRSNEILNDLEYIRYRLEKELGFLDEKFIN